MRTRVYPAKTLFSGSVVGKDTDKNYVGIPGGQNYISKNDFSKEKNFTVRYGEDEMKIANWHKAEAFRKFDDLQGRGNYLLAYFEWKPIKQLSADIEPQINYNTKVKLSEIWKGLNVSSKT